MDLDNEASSLRQLVERAGAVLLTGPADIDGDSIGASLALERLIRSISSARVDVAGEPGHRYGFLPGANDMLPNAQIQGPYDLAVVLDGERRRLDPGVGAAFDSATARVIVDHHRSTKTDGYSLAFVDPDAASTTEIVHQLFVSLQVPVDSETAALLFTGLIFDTGGFRHSNTSPSSHRLAASLLDHGIDHSTIHVRTLVERRPQGLLLMGRVLSQALFSDHGRVVIGCVPQSLMQEIGTIHEDLEGIVDMLIYTEGVEAAILMVERDGGVKLSMRSRGRVDVASLARELDPTGGGHTRAAGVMLMAPMDEILRWLPELVSRAILPSKSL